MSDQAKPNDGRKYHVGDKVEFKDDDGNISNGIVHGVSYQQGRYELAGADYVDDEPVVGTGRMELIKGTENERHSFQYIIVHEHEHKKWHEVNKNNEQIMKRNEERNKRNQAKIEKNPGKDHELEEHEIISDLPPLKQHVREWTDD